MLRQGIELIQNGEKERGSALIEEALESDGNSLSTESRSEALVELGYALINLGRFTDAERRFTQSTKTLINNPSSPLLGASWKGFGVANLYLQRPMQAWDGYQIALNIFEKLNNYEEQANICNNLGYIVARYGQAKFKTNLNPSDFYFKALKIQQSHSIHQGQAITYNNLGLLEKSLRHYQKALEHFSNALRFTDSSSKKLEAGIRNNLGIIERKFGRYGIAQSHLDRSLELYETIQSPLQYADALTTLGDIHVDMGNFKQAQHQYKQALDIYHDKNRTISTADVLLHLGALYRYQGDLNRAKDIYQSALSIYKEEKDKSSIKQANLLLGHVYTDMGDFPKARSHYRSILNSNFEDPQSSDYAGQALAQLGYIAESQKDLKEFQIQFKQIALKYDFPLNSEFLAFMNLKEPPKRTVDSHPADSKLSVPDQCLIALGRYYLRTGELETAVSFFQKGIVRGEITRDSNLHIGGLIGSAAAEELLGHNQKAIHSYELAVESLEQQRTTIPPGQRAFFFRSAVSGFQRLYPYERLVRLLNEAGDAEKAFFYSEHTKARALLEAFSQFDHIQTNLPNELKDHEHRLLERLGAMHALLNEASDEDTAEQVSIYLDKIEIIQQELDQLIETLRRDYPQYASLAHPSPVKANELVLKPNEALLEYEITDDALVVFIVEHGQSVQQITIPISRETLQRKIEQYLAPFELIAKANFSQVGALMRSYDPQLSYEIYQLLLAQPMKKIDASKEILVIPDEILCVLPFSSLVVSEPKGLEWANTPRQGPRLQNIEFAASKRMFRYWQSGAAMTVKRKTNIMQTASKILVVADPIYNADDSRLLDGVLLSHQGESAISTRRRMEVQSKDKDIWEREISDSEEFWRDFIRLDSTSEFAESIRKRNKDQCTVLLGKDANEKRIRSERLSQYRQIHFATHGIVKDDPLKPRQAALVLSNPNVIDENQDTYDGCLTMTEIAELSLNADLVTALACSTGLGEYVGGEGVMNLSRAFQYAGAKSVLVSLWSVADQSTNQLMECMIDEIAQGENCSTALHRAQMQLLDSDFAHPFYWSPFILIGEN